MPHLKSTPAGASADFQARLNPRLWTSLVASALLLALSSHAQNVDLALTKTVDNPNPVEGDIVEFTVIIENLGENGNTATGVQVLDLLPPGLTLDFMLVFRNSSYSVDTGIWEPGVGDLFTGLGKKGELKPLETSSPLTIYARVNEGTAGQRITNRASLHMSEPPDSNPSNNVAEAVIIVQEPPPPANVRVEDSPMPDLAVPVGSKGSVSVRVLGDSENTVHGVTLKAQATKGVALVGGSAKNEDQAVGPVQDQDDPQIANAFLGDLPANGTATAKIDFLVTETGPQTITITVKAANDTDQSDNSATFTIEDVPAEQAAKNANIQVDVSDPIGTFAGNFHFVDGPDLNLGGPLPVFLQRSYDSALHADGVIQSALGPNWQHNWEIQLNVAETNATVVFRRGRLIQFEKDGATWNLVRRTDIGFRLVELAGEFLLADPRSQLMYFFDVQGRFVRLEDGRGNTNSLAYTEGRLASVTDGLGRMLEFTYAGDRLTSVSDGSRTVGFGHTDGNLTSFTGANGKVTGYTYDPANAGNPALMTARTRPEGNTPVTQVYQAEGRVISQADAAGNTTTLDYAIVPDFHVTRIFDALGLETRHFYSNFGELLHITDEAGNNVSTSLDDAGRRSRVQDRKLNSTFITYDPDTGLPTEIRHPGNLRDVFVYSSRTVNGVDFQDLTRITRPDGRSDQFVYDDNGNLIQFVLRDAHAFDYGYNDHGQITSVTNPVGGEVALAYDASARLASATDSDVGATAYEYDSLHRLTQITHPNQDTVQFEYDALNRLTAVTDERTNTTAFAYDDNSRLTNAVDALGQSTRFEYDSLDRLIRTVDRLGHGTHFAYDPRSDLAAVTNRNNFVTRFEYDESRRRTAVIDPAGKTNRFRYDPEGLLISASNSLGETMSLTRDLMGYVTGITDPLGNRVGFQSDTMKRVVVFTNALGNQTAYTYTPRGQLSDVTLPGNLAASYQYDGLGSLTQISDPNNRLWRFTRTPMGRLASFADPLNRTNLYTYDARGRLAEVTFPDGVTLTLTYDGANNVIRRQYSDGTDLHYAHDELNRLVSASGSPVFEFTYDDMDRVTNTRQDGVDFGATYDADGRLTSVSYPGAPGFTVTYTYDSRDRLTSVSDDLTGTSLTFAYDDANRLTGITRPNGVNTTYTYDAAGRLTRIQDGSILDLRFTLDAAGQILETDYAAVPLDPAAAVPIEDTSFTYDNASQISTAGHTYDARGRQTASPGNTFTWDGASRLAGINAVVNGYNALGDLVTRVEGGNTNRYFYNYAVGLHPIMAERDENSGQFTRYYIWSPGGLLLYIINLPGNTVSFPHFDHVGSALALTGAGGTVTDSYAYDPYGKVLAQTGTSTQPFRFNGAFGVRTDGSFHHMRARWYDPGSARFLSKEPIWPVLESPQQLNVYAFANQNPLTFADPLGDEPATLTVGGLVVGWAAVMGIVSSATYIALNIQEQIQAAREIRSEAERQKKLEEKRSRLLRAYNRYRFMGERFGNSSQSTDPTDAQPTAPEAPAPVHPPAPDTGVAGTDGGPGETIPREYINLALECFQQYHREYVDNRRKQCLLGLGGIAPQNPSPQSQGADPGCPAGAVAAHGVLNYIDDPTATPSAGNPDGPGAATTGGYPRPQAGRFVDPPLKFRFSMGFRY